MNPFDVQFENMTIAQLKEMTEQFKELQRENLFYKIKYPTANPPEKKEVEESIMEWLGVEDLGRRRGE